MNESTNGKGNTTERDNWRTPDELFNKLNEQYGFRFDCCALPHNAKCQDFSSNFEAVESINGTAWMNPPFSTELVRKMFEHFFKVVSRGVAIYRGDNIETGVWQDVILEHADWVFVPKGRVKYYGHDGGGARFPSVLIGVGVPAPVGIEGRLLVVSH